MVYLRRGRKKVSDKATVFAKVLVLESDAGSLDRVKAFCDSNHLLPMVVPFDELVETLKQNVDLAGIFLSQSTEGSEFDFLAIGELVSRIRPELPVFLRCTDAASAAAVSEEAQVHFACRYTLDTLDALKEAVSERIFSFSYPAVLVSGLIEMAKTALESQFIGMDVVTEPPYVVLDKHIMGEIFTLVPVETGWCRGYMMLQVDETQLANLVNNHRTHVRAAHAEDFRNLNGVVNELTNLLWGSFKNRYLELNVTSQNLSQVPLVINPNHHHISFGANNPQLCLKHNLASADGTASITVFQKFVFNLSWNPEDFYENVETTESQESSGELEFF
jgi:hypothetical protein